MNDRYLFKAKRLDTNDWILGFLSMHKTGKYFIRPIGGSASSSEEVEKNTICQCTGLKDKNGKLIWENDIVEFQFDNEDCPFPNKDTKKRKGKVFFSDYRASFEYQQYGCSIMNFDELSGIEVEVIGNIFDNPELLEV